MDDNEQRDYAEEKYNREFCGPCGASPCTWDGRPDGFHTDEDPGGTYTEDDQGSWHPVPGTNAATLAAIAEGEQTPRCAQCRQQTGQDGRHLVNGSYACPREHLDAPLVTLDTALAQARELDSWSPEDLLGLVHTAGELWLSTDRADPDDVLNGYQRSLLDRAAAIHLAEMGGDEELPQLDCPICDGKHFERAGIENCAADHEVVPPGGFNAPETWVQYYDPDTGVPLPGPPDTLRELREPS